jgi:hypothetical protein
VWHLDRAECTPVQESVAQAPHRTLNIRSEARNGARSRQTQLAKRSRVAIEKFDKTMLSKRFGRSEDWWSSKYKPDCDRNVIRGPRNLYEHRGLQTHTE